MTKYLQLPISDKDIEDLSVGDVVYLTGKMIALRDCGHKRALEIGLPDGVDLKGGAVFHAGPIVETAGNGYKMIAIGPTTSMRMEEYEADFIKQFGAKIFVGKGGMGKKTALAMKELKAVHLVSVGGCAVLYAEQIKIDGVNWLDLGMPEAMWMLDAEKFGGLVVSIDTKGNNLFDSKNDMYQEKLKQILEK